MIDPKMIDLEYRSLQCGIYRADLTELLSSEYLIDIYGFWLTMAEYLENFIKFYLLTHWIFSSKGNLQTVYKIPIKQLTDEKFWKSPYFFDIYNWSKLQVNNISGSLEMKSDNIPNKIVARFRKN